jgi:hypothetical protein
MTISNEQREMAAPDVLILHGMSRHLVDYFRSFAEAIGVSAGAVIDLPAGGKPQEQKVDHYIRNCKIPLVLLTFDEEQMGATSARFNVYDEIARCRELGKREDTIVLQQTKEGRTVALPTNVTGQMVVIEFDDSHLHTMLPQLLRELMSRQIPRSISAEERTFEAGGILSDFLDKMVCLSP